MKKLFLFFILILIVSLPVTGCARKVTGVTANPTMVVTVNFNGPVDLNACRYFLILNRDSSHLTGPDLGTNNKNKGWSLPFDGAPPAGLGQLTASAAPNFIYTDFYELSLTRGVSHGTAPTFNSTGDPTISITNNGTSLTFSIPLDPLVANYEIQVVSTDTSYVILDFIDSGYNGTWYQWLPTTRGYNSGTINTIVGGVTPMSADITSLSIFVI